MFCLTMGVSLSSVFKLENPIAVGSLPSKPGLGDLRIGEDELGVSRCFLGGFRLGIEIAVEIQTNVGRKPDSGKQTFQFENLFKASFGFVLFGQLGF